jgi:hypothetical protein
MEALHYSHTQRGYLLSGSLVGAALIVMALSLRIGWNAANILVEIVLVAMAFLFYSMTVEISGDILFIRFGPGLIRKQIPLSGIRDVRIVRNPWYYGWGIHVTPQGWLYNVSGLAALEIELESGKCLRIGTDDPRGLQEAIVKTSRK